ncbi:hypothetical protein GH5_04655 [Leishmania sp. Ghana 2012 LV757]|uniref:hypothetical protein n=1 Tax=Leishmania sp. Ghana 2012 LV757 TaxID=2803181 RepID=UPI001B632AF5|nr:hypothetical protein GH5_04655 [Leishmania sp. Ghana 2012 LV757]
MASRGEHIRLEKGSLVKSHYEVVTSIGSGNFSKVYRVIDLHLPPKEQRRKPLAMKVIKKEYSSDAKYEKQMLIALHKNDTNRSARVSKMYECFVWQECPVFIMPIHGPSLRNRRLGVNRGVVTYEKLLEFSYDLLETMEFVHFQCHMVHTDLKPENILIADCNVADDSMGDAWVVCDFGSASLWRMDKLDSDLISTRPYRAPEVVLGNKWHYAADMWSVGCILYEVAVGHRLFEIRDDLTHLHMMDRRIGRLPEAFSKHSKYSSKYFNSRGDFLFTPDVIRFSKCRLTPIRDMFKNDRDFRHLLKGLLTYNPDERMTAAEALALPMFDAIRVARKERQRQADAAAEAHRQRRCSAGAAALGGGTSSRLTGRSDHNTLDYSTDDAKKFGRSSSALLDRGATGKQSFSAQPFDIMTAASSIDDVAGAKSGISSHGQHYHQLKRGEASSSNVAGSHLAPAVSSSSKLGNQATAASSEAAAAAVAATNTTVAPIAAEDTSSFAAPNVSAPSATPQGKRQSFEVRGRDSRAPIVQTGSSRRSGGPSSVTGVVTKEVPRQRPVVNNHRASSLGSVSLVSQLALHRSKAQAPACDDAATPPLSKSRRPSREQSGKRCSSRTVSPARSHRTTTPHKGTGSGSQRGGTSGATGGGGNLLSAPDRPNSPRQHLQQGLCSGSDAAKRQTRTSPRCSATAYRLETLPSAITRSPRMTVKASSAAAPALGPSMSMPVITTPPQQGARTGTLRSRSPQKAATGCDSMSHRSATIEDTADVMTSLRLEPSMASSRAPSLPPSATGPPTPHRPSASLDTPLGKQSPLQRGVTTVGMSTPTEAPARAGFSDIGNKSGGVVRASESRVEATAGDGGHGGRQVASKAVSSLAAMKSGDVDNVADGNINADGNGRVNSSFESASELVISSAPSPTNNSRLNSMYNLYGSPHATDYRSPERCRPLLETSTDDTSGTSSPVMIARNARSSFRSNECRGVENAQEVPLATGMIRRGQRPSAAAPASPPQRSQRKLQPPQLGDRFRSPRERSRAARSPSSLADRRCTTAGRLMSMPTVPTRESDKDTHESLSTTPLKRTQQSRSDSRNGSLAGALDIASAPTVDSPSRMVSPSMSTTPAVDRSAPLSLTPIHSPSTIATSTAIVPTHVRRRSAVRSQRATVTVSGNPPQLVPSDVPQIRDSASPPVTASLRTVRPRPAYPPLEEPTPVSPKGSAMTSHLPVAVTRSRHLSLSVDNGRPLNPKTTATTTLAGVVSASSTGATSAATVLRQPPHRSHHATDSLECSSGGEGHICSEANTAEAGVATAPQPLGPHMTPRPQQLSEQAPACSGSSPLPAIAATAAAAGTPIFMPSNSAHGASERRAAFRRSSSGGSVKSVSTQYLRTPPEVSPRPARSPSSTNISFKAATDAESPLSTTAALTQAGTRILLRSACSNGAANESGPITSPFPVATPRSSRSASFHAASLSPCSTAAPGTTSANSLRSPSDGVSAASTHIPRKSPFASTPPMPTATYRRSKSPRDTSPALVTTDLPSNSISGDVTPTVTPPVRMQPFHEPPSQTQLQQQPLTTLMGTGAGTSKLSTSSVTRFTKRGVAPARRSVQQQSFGASAAVTPCPHAPGLIAAPVRPSANTASISSPKQASTASFGVVSSSGAHSSPVNAAVIAISADASSGSTMQPKHRRNTHTLRHIIVPRSSTSSLPQTSRAELSSPTAEDSDRGDEGGGEQIRGTSVNSHPPKQHYRDMLSRSSVTPIPPPRTK